MNRIICIAGPTASGKTALAVELAKELNGEVVSCDSMQVYRRMDIGTAKPTKEEMQGIVHHMIDVAEPDEDFSVSRYCDMASPIVDDILARGKTAVIAGGTGLYMDSLIRGNAFAPFPATGVRERLEAQADAEGMESMLEWLRSVDPASAARLHLSDRKRIIRALEVFLETGETITEHNRKTQSIPPKYNHPGTACQRDSRQVHRHAGHRLQGVRKCSEWRGNRGKSGGGSKKIQPSLCQAAAYLVPPKPPPALAHPADWAEK